MTLIEIMIVVIIMSLIATAVGMAVLPVLVDSRRRIASVDAATIQTAAIAYLVDRGTGECPTAGEIASAGLLNEQGRTRDPWGHEFVVECEGNSVRVHSLGPDGQPGTEDDVR